MFDIHAQQPGLFTVELANDNVNLKRRATGALDLERLGEIFHDCSLEDFAAVALLTGQRDTLTEIRIDGMRLHRSTFHTAGVRALRALLSRGCHSSAIAPVVCLGLAQLSRGLCQRKLMYLSVAQRTTLSEKGLQKYVRLQQRVQASTYSDHLISVAGKPGMHPLWSIEEG